MLKYRKQFVADGTALCPGLGVSARGCGIRSWYALGTLAVGGAGRREEAGRPGSQAVQLYSQLGLRCSTIAPLLEGIRKCFSNYDVDVS